jgi:hypothetical protein
MFTKIQEPKTAAITAGIPNLINTSLFTFCPTKKSLKILLKKWTTPVNAIANSTGKKIIKIGVRMVPSPNPEKKVRMATKNAAIDMMMISI